MTHEIQTNAKSHSTAAITRLHQICDQIATEHHAAFRVATNATEIRISINCNGAALRDLVSDLDRAGFLD